MASFIDRLRLGILAFKEAYLTAPVTDTDDWTAQGARSLRYEILWAMYEQTAYRDVHKWATAYRKRYSLYKYIRPIYNPAYRLGEFWKAHLFGGLLDPDAGDDGAIPIVTDNEALRPVIADLWKWSRWSVKKDILTVRGAILGDACIRIIDDVARGRVYLDLLHPGSIEYVEKDPFGNVKAYGLKETRDDPRGKSNTVTYSEHVSRAGDYVIYETFLNGDPYAWDENVDRTGIAVSTWSEPYGFVPMVTIQHNDMGLEWGCSSLHPIRAKVQEVDDIASQVSDQIRKTINPVWLLSGAQRPASGVLALTGATDTADIDRPAPGREEIRTMYVGSDGSAEAMVPKLDLANVLAHVNGILKEIERDVLELSSDIHTASGDASGRALRVARQPVTSKVVQRRANYDAEMVAIHQMAIAIGGWRGYYPGFDLNSYAKGDLDHSIAERSVFDEDPLDVAEISTAEWNVVIAMTKAGVPLKGCLRDQGWDEERIAALGIEEEEPVAFPTTGWMNVEDTENEREDENEDSE